MLVESVSVLDEHAALTEEAQQDVGGSGTHHLSSNKLSSYSNTSTCEVIKQRSQGQCKYAAYSFILYQHEKSLLAICNTRINDIAIAMSYSSRADPGLRVAFKYLNV